MSYEYLGGAGQIVGTIAGTPGGGTDCVQTLTIGGTPDGGTFRLRYDGWTTANITWTSVDNTLLAAITAALIALPNIDAAGVVSTAGTLSSGIGTVTMTFSGGNMLKKVVELITVANNSLTGTSPTLAVAMTTPGVDSAFKYAPVDSLCVDTQNHLVYQKVTVNTWQKVGAQ